MKNLLTLCLMLFCSFVKAQQLDKHYKIFDTKKRQVVTIPDLVSDMRSANVLFFGEEHNDSVAHYLELEIFKQLNSEYKTKVILSLEMFHTDVQPIIDEYLSGVISDKNFIKEARAWSNYKDYQPLLVFAKRENLKVIGANAATRYSNAVTKNGLLSLSSFPESSKNLFPPLPIDTLQGRYHEKFNALLGGHSMGGMKVYQSQNFWDATMAWSIAKALKADETFKILHLNGRFHTDEKLGTYAQLKKYAPKAIALNISTFPSADFENPDWEKHKHLADYIILTDPQLRRTH